MGFFRDVIKDSRRDLSRQTLFGPNRIPGAEEAPQSIWSGESQSAPPGYAQSREGFEQAEVFSRELSGSRESIIREPDTRPCRGKNPRTPWTGSEDIPRGRSADALESSKEGRDSSETLAKTLSQPLVKERRAQEGVTGKGQRDPGMALMTEQDGPVQNAQERMDQRVSGEREETRERGERRSGDLLEGTGMREEVPPFPLVPDSDLGSPEPEKAESGLSRENDSQEQARPHPRDSFLRVGSERAPAPWEFFQEESSQKPPGPIPREGGPGMTAWGVTHAQWQFPRQEEKRTEPAVPRVRIGQVNVMVQGEVEPNKRKPVKEYGEDLASRTFLRSL